MLLYLRAIGKIGNIFKFKDHFSNSIQWVLFTLASARELVTESSEELSLVKTNHGPPRNALGPALAHHVLVVYSRSFCSGSFIHSKVVLTVASCFPEKTNNYGIKIKFAVKNYMDAGPSVSVVDKKEHEFYKNKGDLDNDIALLILKKHIMFGFGERKIILAEPGTMVPINSFVSVTGWGKDVSKSQENDMLQSDMQVIDREECDKTYPGIIFPSIFCAKYDLANRLSDNGGAAVFKGLVVGISSYGANLEDPPHIALFTNVSYFYKWIKLNTERLLLKHCSHEHINVHDEILDY